MKNKWHDHNAYYMYMIGSGVYIVDVDKQKPCLKYRKCEKKYYVRKKTL